MKLKDYIHMADNSGMDSVTQKVKVMKPDNRQGIRKMSGNTGFRMAMFAAVLAAAVIVPGVSAFASTTNSVVTSSFDTLLSLVESIVSAIGAIITLWGVSEFGISMQGAQGTMQAEAFKRIAGGLIMVLAPQILDIIT